MLGHSLLLSAVRNTKFLPLGLPRRVANDAVLVLVSDLRLAEPIKLLLVDRVQEDGVHERNKEPDKGYAHSNVVTLVISQQTGERREESPATDRCDDVGAAALGVTTETPDRKGKDEGEDAALEEEHQAKKGSSSLSAESNSQADEYHDPCHEAKQNDSRLHIHHQTRSSKSSYGEDALAYGVTIAALRSSKTSRFNAIRDKISSYPHLGSYVAELCYNAEEELVLLAHRLVLIASEAGGLLGL